MIIFALIFTASCMTLVVRSLVRRIFLMDFSLDAKIDGSTSNPTLSHLPANFRGAKVFRIVTIFVSWAIFLRWEDLRSGSVNF